MIFWDHQNNHIHFEDEVAPIVAVVVPVGQLMQELCPDVGWYVPIGHLKHW